MFRRASRARHAHQQSTRQRPMLSNSWLMRFWLGSRCQARHMVSGSAPGTTAAPVMRCSVHQGSPCSVAMGLVHGKRQRGEQPSLRSRGPAPLLATAPRVVYCTSRQCHTCGSSPDQGCPVRLHPDSADNDSVERSGADYSRQVRAVHLHEKR